MPLVWLVDAYREGERSQIRALVQALGWPCDTKQLAYRRYDIITHLLPTGSLRGIQRASQGLLKPPWPDLIVTCGVRNEPVCRWIRAQSAGKSRYVHVGRPWADPSLFDLVITTPQYRVPERDNVVQNELTLHRISREGMSRSAADWENVWRHLRRPLIAVLVGGHSGPFTLGRRAAARLGQEASKLARKTGGSLLVTTSSRTPSTAIAVLQEALEEPHYFHTWRSNGGPNPYLAMLSLADRFIVTADSIAMLSEACAMGKRVDMFDLGGMRDRVPHRKDFRVGGVLYGALLRWGWAPLTRDITLVHRQLVASGRAAWLGEEPLPLRQKELTDMSRAIDAIKDLFDQTGSPVEAGRGNLRTRG